MNRLVEVYVYRTWHVYREEGTRNYHLYRWIEGESIDDSEWCYFGKYRSKVSAIRDVELAEREEAFTW